MNSFKTFSSSTPHMPLPVKCDSHVQVFCLASWDIKPKSCCQSSFRWRPWVTLWSWSMFVISLLNFLLLMLWPLCISELSPHIQKPLWEQWVFKTDITCVLWQRLHWCPLTAYWCPLTVLVSSNRIWLGGVGVFVAGEVGALFNTPSEC